MKLYVVKFKEPKTYIEIRDVAKRVDSLCMITKNPDGDYEFQSEKAAKAVTEAFDCEMSVIEYKIRDVIK